MNEVSFHVFIQSNNHGQRQPEMGTLSTELVNLQIPQNNVPHYSLAEISNSGVAKHNIDTGSSTPVHNPPRQAYTTMWDVIYTELQIMLQSACV